jgi:hypothetical protein
MDVNNPVYPEDRQAHNGGGAVIRALPGPLSSPGMAYWMVACTVYLFIVTLGVNVRFCRVQVVFDGLVSTG